MANCPPKLAPAVVPKIDGLTSGSRNTPWTTAPPVARAAPASKAAPMRVARRPSSVERSVGSARLPCPTSKASATAPTKSTSKTTYVRAIFIC